MTDELGTQNTTITVPAIDGDDVIELTLKAPGRNEKGYFRRMRRWSRIMEGLADLEEMRADPGNYDARQIAKVAVKLMDDIFGFLLDFLKAPAGVDLPAVLEELSENEVMTLFTEFGGVSSPLAGGTPPENA